MQEGHSRRASGIGIHSEAKFGFKTNHQSQGRQNGKLVSNGTLTLQEKPGSEQKAMQAQVSTLSWTEQQNGCSFTTPWRSAHQSVSSLFKTTLHTTQLS
jgi:hypothetical protein